MAEFRKTSRNKTMISEIKSKLEKMYRQVNNYYYFEKEEVEREHFNNKRNIELKNLRSLELSESEPNIYNRSPTRRNYRIK